MNQQKGFSNIVFIVLVVILVGVVGYFVLTKKQKQAPVQTPPVADETADWQTYRNEEFGFEVRYPIDWYIKEYVLSGYDTEFLLLLSPAPFTVGGDPREHMGSRVDIALLGTPHSDQELKKSGPTEGIKTLEGGRFDSVRYEPTTFAGVSANRIYTDSPPAIGHLYTKFIFNHKGSGWMIVHPNIDYEGVHEQVYGQILSTFRFLD